MALKIYVNIIGANQTKNAISQFWDLHFAFEVLYFCQSLQLLGFFIIILYLSEFSLNKEKNYIYKQKSLFNKPQILHYAILSHYL